MAGRSKWSNIRHRKAAQDAKRGKIFTKLIREITVAAREGGSEIADNPRLRAVVDKALSANMTRDTIERAIKRGAGEDDGGNMSEITYEGYGPGGVAVLVETMTDNVNRTVGEVRHAFTKSGGNLGTDGSVAYLFTKRGEIVFPPGTDEDQLTGVALEAGAEDLVSNEDGTVDVFAPWEEFHAVRDALAGAGLEAESGEVIMHPATSVVLDRAGAEAIIELVDALAELDDVQNVCSNAEIGRAHV